jgi:parallel beta-helix repeat protein
VTDNKISRCREGIEITKNSNRNEVLNCEINVTGYDIKLVSSKENRITGNSITGTSHSTVLQSSLNNVIENNTLRGLKLSASHENYIFNNSDCWIELFDSDSNELIGNNFSFCSTYGVYLSRSDKNILRDNSINRNNVFPDEYIHEDPFYEQDPLGLSGIYLSKSYHNILENNSASYNLFNGIRLDDSDYNLFANNTIESNNEAGLLLHNCSQNKVYHNEIKRNKYGIKTESTLSFKEWKFLENIIEENIFENNGRNVAKSYFELPKFQINGMMILIIAGLIGYFLVGSLIILVSIFAGILIYDKVKKRKSE